MARYRLKAVMVDPKQFTGGEANAKELTDWIAKNGGTAQWWPKREHAQVQLPERLFITTPDGLTMAADAKGDWIVKKGKTFTVVSDADFKENYEQV